MTKVKMAGMPPVARSVGEFVRFWNISPVHVRLRNAKDIEIVGINAMSYCIIFSLVSFSRQTTNVLKSNTYNVIVFMVVQIMTKDFLPFVYVL
jgi:hypothetical protein